MKHASIIAGLFGTVLATAGCGGGDDGGGPQPTAVQIVQVFPALTFERPLYVTAPPGDGNRVFVVTQRGVIFSVAKNEAAPAMKIYLDISGRVGADQEMGLLGLAFDPDYRSNGFLYVNYNPRFDRSSTNGRRTNISRFHVSSDDPDRADAFSETVLLSYAQPTPINKGGWLGFGPDGKLYIASGDGGGQSDPQGNGQNLGVMLGKILRINPDGTLPPDNPWFTTEGVYAQIWAYGLRNPFRASFDRATGELWAGDVGQSRFEEVDKIVRGGNYGWRKFEGNHLFKPNDPEVPDALPPVLEYKHDNGRCSIIGGYVYRGGTLGGSFDGHYFFADYCTGELFEVAANAEAGAAPTLLGVVPGNPTSFGEDAEGELYVTSLDGHIYKLERGPDPEPAAN